MKHKKALTFIELLVAVSMFAIVVVSIYSAFSSGILNYRRMDSGFELYQNARMIFSRLELDLKNSFIYSDSDSKFKGSGQGLSFFAVKDYFTKDKVFVEPVLIKYELSESILKRSLFKGLDALRDNAVAQPEELAENVKEISFEYAYYSSSPTPDKPYDWQASWPNPDQITGIPLAVRIKLSLISKDKRQTGPIEFIKIIPLPLGKKIVPAGGSGGP